MRHNNREFDKSSYDSNDQRAKDAIVGYLNKNGYEDIVPREDYFFDVAAKKDKNYFFEVEINKDHALIFVVFNTDCSQAWFIDGDTVDSSPIGTIQNSSRIGSPHLKEPFFHVPKEKATLIKIN